MMVTRVRGNIGTTFFDLTTFELAEDCHCILLFAWGKVDLHKVGAMLTPGVTAMHG